MRFNGGTFLNALGKTFGGYGQDQEDNLQHQRQQGMDAQNAQSFAMQQQARNEASQLNSAQLGNYQSEIAARDGAAARKAMEDRVINDNWTAAINGDRNAQAKIVTIDKSLAPHFMPKAPEPYHVQGQNGVNQVGPDGKVTFVPYAAGFQREAPPRDPVADHAANRAYDAAHPTRDPAVADMRKDAQSARNEARIVQQYTAATKKYSQTADAIQAIAENREGALRGDPIAQQTLLQDFIKLNLPGQIVTSGELHTYAGLMGLGDKAGQFIQRLQQGSPLSQQQVNLILGHADNLVTERRKGLNYIRDQYASRAQKQGVDPESLVDWFGFLPDGRAPESGSGGMNPTPPGVAPSAPPARPTPPGAGNIDLRGGQQQPVRLTPEQTLRAAKDPEYAAFLRAKGLLR